MTEILFPIKNYPIQQSVFSSPARIVTVVKGRRFGFTKGAANHTIRTAIYKLKKHGLWVDTINSNIEKYVDRYFIPALRRLPQELWSWQKQQKVLRIRDFYMDFRSADNPENIEGFDYDFVILNEAGIILKDMYLWQNAIRPMTWVDNCNIIIGGTPKGAGGEFEKLYRRGLDPHQTQYASFHFDSFSNPYLPKEVILEDMKSMPQRVIEQEIYAKFLEDTGIVFRGVEAICTAEPKKPELDHMYVIGADVAKLVDFTVLTVYDRGNNNQVFQMRFNGLEWPLIRSRIQTLSNHYNKALVMLDSTGVGESTYDDLTYAGVPVEAIHFTNELKKQMIDRLANWIELRRLRMLKDDETINEFKSFTYDISDKTNRIHYGAPSGFHDDIVISHALAIWSLQPLIIAKKVGEMSLIERDIYDKTHSDPNDLEEYDENQYEPLTI